MLRTPLGDVSNQYLQQSGKSKSARPLEKRQKAPVAKPRALKDRRKDVSRLDRFRDQEMDVPLLCSSYCDAYNYDQCCYPQFDDGMLPGMQGGMVQGVQPWAYEPYPVYRSAAQKDAAPKRKEVDESFVYPGHPAYTPIEVSTKNTFIELPAPRTPSPSGRQPDPRTPAIAATCPPKYIMGEGLREQLDATRAEADEAAQQFAGQKVNHKPVESLASVGSLLHKAGLCKPCAWVHHAKGCQRGSTCEFCHTCPPGEIKKRKKEKTVLIRKRRTQQTNEPALGPRLLSQLQHAPEANLMQLQLGQIQEASFMQPQMQHGAVPEPSFMQPQMPGQEAAFMQPRMSGPESNFMAQPQMQVPESNFMAQPQMLVSEPNFMAQPQMAQQAPVQESSFMAQLNQHTTLPERANMQFDFSGCW